MNAPIRQLAAVGALALMLAPGCGWMSKRWDEVTERSDRNHHAQTTTVDLNSAGHKRLAALPGLSDDDAERIIANRPYANRRDLVRKGVLSENKFDSIRDEVHVDNAKN